MEKGQTLTAERFISCWNEEFQDHHLTLAGLKSPHELMGAVLKIFDRIGYDSDSVMSLPPEESRNNHMIYYQDLLPIINTTRSFNYMVSVMSQVYTITISHFLQPTTTASHSMLMLLFNLMLFIEERLSNIAVSEEELFSRNDQLKILEDKKNNLLQMLNEQIQNKCKRSERLEKLQQSIIQTKEESKLEREGLDEEKQHSETLSEDNRQLELSREQKRTQRDADIGEVERLRAMRVYDADDIQAQAKQAMQNVQEAEKKLTTLGDTLMQKENSLKNLQTTKYHLDINNNLLDEIIKQAECFKDFENRDLDSDSKEGELDVLKTELSEEQASLSELIAAREEVTRTRQQDQADRQLGKSKAQSALREAEEKDVKSRELSKRKLQRNQEMKELTGKYEEDKAKGMEDLAELKSTFCQELKKAEDILLKKVGDVKKQIEEKLRNRAA